VVYAVGHLQELVAHLSGGAAATLCGQRLAAGATPLP
jgi:hypothetical protein